MTVDLVYVSWGGTGRAAALRAALAKAAAEQRGLTYLAVLDDSTFGDIDEATLELVKDELAWLLDAQLELTRSQIGVDDVEVRVLVQAGDVADAIAETVEAVEGTADNTEVLIGAPIPLTADESVSELIKVLGRRVDAPVTLIEP